MDRMTGAPPAVPAPAVDPSARGAVRNLIDHVSDGVEGLAKSAELVEDEVAQALFELWSNERKEFLAELHNLAVDFGADEEDPGTARGAVHRAWMTAKNAITGDDEAVIESAINGEEAAMEAYEAALSTGLPDDARTVIQRQYDQVREIHERLTKWGAV